MATPIFPFPATSYALTSAGAAAHRIGGNFRDAASGAVREVENPRHGAAMGSVAWGDAADVEAAVAAARAAFPGWRDTPPKARAQILHRWRVLLEAHTDELAWLASHENGKIVSEARASVEKGIECLEFAVAVPNAQNGGVMEVSRGISCEVRQEPLGVVAGVVPFNFPAMVPMWMVPLALAAGNAFILKPSEKVPFTALRMAQLAEEAGLPAGVLQVVQGGQPVVEALCDHPEIRALAFVGSTRVAKLVYSRTTALGKRCLALGGAKNHLVVVPDADPEMTATNVVASSMGSAGQRCMAASVMVAVGDVQHIVDLTVAKARAIRMGEDIGTIIDAEAVTRIERFIEDAVQRGAKLLLDGRGQRPDGSGGYWVGPTILDDVTADMPAGCDEIFGPVLSIIRARTLDQAIAIENDNAYGNAAAIYTSNGGTAEYAIARFSAGMCGVNIGVPVPREPFAFGGWNDSRIGHGDITGADGYRFWSQARKVTTKWALQKDATWMS
ncbi:MAG: CoA-acylating methylmalonate-semialdehyde dehydrogenase [Deltaproteobacteria bacterium]|nr:CoA-acylating methylmalonate-semialdehyde dehydrogenase [Deltaproteobacteria bacterium]